MHLCGNVQRHFPTLIRELNVKSFDTGFPINFTTLRDEVGEEVEIQGGVPVGSLLNGTPPRIYEKTREILLKRDHARREIHHERSQRSGPLRPACQYGSHVCRHRQYGILV